ncbi:testis-expressed protein 9-like isoform X2 [Atheta coriaria]|uniref:testis-expressed protein 9-like isoform X2 n=1 Tax=Dalotia coriaria TaxID=877792 RepID=UPI0031F38481
MDETQLLLKEREYEEINKKLNMRTRELMERIEDFKKTDIDDLFKQGSSSDSRVNRVKALDSKLIADLPRSKSACNPTVAKFTTEELKILNVPEDINNFELDKLNKDHREKCEEVQKLHKDKVKLQEDKEKYLQQGNIARCQILKMETQLSLSQSKLQTKESENLVLSKEVEGLNRELKNTKTNAQNGEVRCQRALEELSKVKLSLRNMQQNEKDFKAAHKKNSNALNDSIKRLEKQKFELLAGFKKQQALIGNLKQQKINIQAMKFNEKAEGDFIKMMTDEDTCV